MNPKEEVSVSVRATFNQHNMCVQYKVFANRESSVRTAETESQVHLTRIISELVGEERFDTPVMVALLPDWLASDLMVLMMRRGHISGIGEWYNNIDVYDHGDAHHRAWVGPKSITYLQLQELSRRALWHYASAYKRLTDQQRYERLTDTIKVSSSKMSYSVRMP